MRAMFPKDHRRNIQPIPPYIAQTEQRFHLASAHPMKRRLRTLQNRRESS